MKMSRVVPILLFVTALVPVVPGAQAGGAKSVAPNLAGRWELVPEQSDIASEASAALLAPQPRDARPMGGRRGPGGGWGGVGRSGPGGGGPGGRGSGGGGGRGWGRPPDGDVTPQNTEERATLREAVRLAVDAAPVIEIVQDAVQIEMLYPREPELPRRSFFTDGNKVPRARWSRKAQWKKEGLHIETRTPRLKILEAVALAPEGDQLRIEVRATRDGFSGQLVFKRVYRRIAQTS